MALKTTLKRVIEVSDWDELVEATYGRTYNFQQQDGCKNRGVVHFSVPHDYPEDFENDSVPEIVNGREMGVSFKAWLARDPEQKLVGQQYNHELELFWQRNFYPNFGVVVNDLHAKGLLPAGEYLIDIDW